MDGCVEPNDTFAYLFYFQPVLREIISQVFSIARVLRGFQHFNCFYWFFNGFQMCNTPWQWYYFTFVFTMAINYLIKPMFSGLISMKVTYEDWTTFIEQKEKRIYNDDDIPWYFHLKAKWIRKWLCFWDVSFIFILYCLLKLSNYFRRV